MPKLTKEISSGAQFQRSSENGRNLTDAQTRVFRILLETPGEVVNVQDVCNITIGKPHPYNQNIYCVSWDVKFEGESRMVLLATFNYQSTPAAQDEDKNKQPPDVRPANWSTSTSLIEVPVRSWVPISQGGGRGAPEAAVNTAGDMYDGVSKFEATVTITVEQFVRNDPTVHCTYAGNVNKVPWLIGTLLCNAGSLMFRGVQCRPVVEAWGDEIFRGWTATYEFSYRYNWVEGLWDHAAKKTYSENIGWDIAVPQTGFNVTCDLNAADVEKTGMPLRHDASGKIEGWPNNLQLPQGVAVGQKARGHVLVYAYDNGGASQLPCAQPIPLNDDGTPRSSTANPKVILRRYRTNEETDFVQQFGLRFQ